MNPSDNRRGKDWHHERVTEVIAHEAAQFIAREAVPTTAGGSLITVTHAASLANGERIIVFVSVFPDEQAKSALAFLDRHREAFSNHLKSHTRLGPLPRIDFQIDNGELVGEPPKS